MRYTTVKTLYSRIRYEIAVKESMSDLTLTFRAAVAPDSMTQYLRTKIMQARSFQ
jgi:hypothetical protein